MPKIQKPKKVQYSPDDCAFEVWDVVLNDWADRESLADEPWAENLTNSAGGWAILEDGTLLLCDDEENYVTAPNRRFRIVFED